MSALTSHLDGGYLGAEATVEAPAASGAPMALVPAPIPTPTSGIKAVVIIGLAALLAYHFLKAKSR